MTLDLKKLPHLLIAGATGSGKSVCVNSIITSLIYNYEPNHVRFILVDPKMVELQFYNGLAHLLTPVITEPHIAPRALKWATAEMERRYRLLSAMNTRDIDRYNEKVDMLGGDHEKLPYIVIIMDELADLMMIAAKEIEGFITRIAQKARAVGIHLVLATQRPSVDVITGIIKANFPARIAFQVAQKTDSRTILDQNGAEKLLGKGDMLYQSPMSSFPVRIQGAFISEDEVMSITSHLRKLASPRYIDIEEDIFGEDEDDDEYGMRERRALQGSPENRRGDEEGLGIVPPAAALYRLQPRGPHGGADGREGIRGAPAGKQAAGSVFVGIQLYGGGMLKHPVLMALLLSCFFRPEYLLSHYQSTRDYRDVIRHAKAVAVAEVVSEKQIKSRCDTSFHYELRPLHFLKGSMDTGKTYPFSYTIHFWKRAVFPWQEDCPSVHYSLPPISDDMSRGAKVIITFEYWEPLKRDAVTSTRNIRDLEEVKSLLESTR